MPEFNTLTKIMAVTNVAEEDFRTKPAYIGIKVMMEKSAEYISRLNKLVINTFICKGSFM